jgi:phosphotransferase system  glucose/maltose/N-acetylglucosamine-specific IIC component
MRAAASALLFFIMNIIGLALGPTFLGLLSDFLQTNKNLNAPEALRWSLIGCNFIYLASAVSFYLAAKTLKSDLEERKETA